MIIHIETLFQGMNYVETINAGELLIRMSLSCLFDGVC